MYFGVNNKARISKKVYFGVDTKVPIYENGGIQVPLKIANINKFFDISKSNGNFSGDFSDYFTIDSDSCGSSTNYNSAWGTFDTPDTAQEKIFSVTTTTDINSISLSISNTGDALGYIEVNGTTVVAIGGETTLDSSCNMSNIASGAVIAVWVLLTSNNGDSISFDITVNDAVAPGTSSDWEISDNIISGVNSGIKIVPGIFGEPLTYCEVTLTAKTLISNVILSGKYFTESGCDLLTVKVNNTYILNEASGDSSFSQLWKGTLSEGDKIYLYYSKDQSADNASESDTEFVITCNSLIEGTIIGYETKPIARKVKKIYIGVDGKARLCYSDNQGG